MSIPVYYGEIACMGKKKNGDPCRNRAYWRGDEGSLTCGVHKKSDSTELPKNPRAKEKKAEQIEEHKKTVEACRRRDGGRGNLTCTKMQMMRDPEWISGYLRVFPNFKHGKRKDGWGIPSLSPKSIGSIDHKMPGWPPAKNLENYHQGAKVFPGEPDGGVAVRLAMYKDATPYRHKFEHPLFVGEQVKGNKNIPLYSVYYDREGKERRYTYIGCRYFYCHWYQRLVERHPDFLALKVKLEAGYHIQLIGYDAYMPGGDLYDHYRDPSRPFGHELVLYTMLLGERPYPWERYREEHKEAYDGVIP